VSELEEAEQDIRLLREELSSAEVRDVTM